MQPVDHESSDDDLYDSFINAMAEEFGAAEEVRPDVVHVWSVVDCKTDPRPFELRVTREQLRLVTRASINIFDDTQGDVSVRATNPVHAGLDAFMFDTQEFIDSGSQLSRTYEFENGRMRRLNLN